MDTKRTAIVFGCLWLGLGTWWSVYAAANNAQIVLIVLSWVLAGVTFGAHVVAYSMVADDPWNLKVLFDWVGKRGRRRRKRK